ncbi:MULTISPECIES: hypothetical protein [Mycolicibacterium]|uniref:DUF2867 domain-containing protein n=1 Tax=Mycolicibacterium septicum TaxID=98668 RepID=A0ABW9LM22_9MYCO|nr:hypothetical protein JVX93_07455 [Mycolicibacterium boenickei]SER09500.1 hypothetical protein SAMN04488583_4276 [Mycobacterium sp. 88mf]SFF86111.1 hypothetical protein SAMN04488582_104388 [Mycobacterium sp. 455mf]
MTSPEPELTRRMALDESLLLGYPNSALDLLFRQSEAGPIPDGDTRGTLLAWPGTWLAKPLALLVRVIIWQGKVLDRREGVLRNKVTPFGLRLVKARLSVASSWVDDGDCVLIDYSTTSFLARMVRDEIRQVGPGLYLGVVWLWRKRVGWFTIRSTG